MMKNLSKILKHLTFVLFLINVGRTFQSLIVLTLKYDRLQ